jgi:predicted nucleotidyltransferase
MEPAPRSVLEDLRRQRDAGALEAHCRRLGITLLVAFGSALDEGVAEPRDLDLAVLLEPGRGFVAVVGEMLGWLGSDAIDVVDLARADVVVRYEALAAGELLHEREYGTFDELQIGAVLRMADTRWLRDLRLRALAR